MSSDNGHKLLNKLDEVIERVGTIVLIFLHI